MKKLFILIFFGLVSVIGFGCDKVHHEQSAIKVTSIGVVNGDEVDKDPVIQDVDVVRNFCEDSSKCYTEPFYDTSFKINVYNTLKQNVYFSHMYYIIKNYYGNGNDYISPNIAISGSSMLGASRDDDDDDIVYGDNENTNQAETSGTIYGMFLPTCSGNRCLPQGKETVDPVGLKNVIVYIHALTETGDGLTVSTATTVNINSYNNCNDDDLAVSACSSDKSLEVEYESEEDIEDDFDEEE